MILDRVRDTLHKVITSPRGDALLAVRLPKDLARRANAALGQPICAREELAKRRAARARLAELRAEKARGISAAAATREQAPVVVYVDRERNARELARIVELLDAKSIAHRVLDVAGDETTLAFVTREARCAPDDLPVVFVGATAIGGYRALVESDTSGALARALGTG